MSERGADFDAKMAACDKARTALAKLIDEPDKTVSVDEYRAKIKAAMKANQRAHKAMMAAWE